MPPPPTALVSPVDPALLEIVEAQAGGDWTIVPLAQVECGARTYEGTALRNKLSMLCA